MTLRGAIYAFKTPPSVGASLLAMVVNDYAHVQV
jgi:hypothetical protein